MQLSKIIKFPFVLPVSLYVGFRLIRAKGGDGAIEFIKNLGKEFDNHMLMIDQILPQGSHSHKRAVRDLRESYRKRIKEASVKKS